MNSKIKKKKKKNSNNEEIYNMCTLCDNNKNRNCCDDKLFTRGLNSCLFTITLLRGVAKL